MATAKRSVRWTQETKPARLFGADAHLSIFSPSSLAAGISRAARAPQVAAFYRNMQQFAERQRQQSSG
jgi:hypothetical protein